MRRKIKYIVLCTSLWASAVLYLVHSNNSNDNKVENEALRFKDDTSRDDSAPLSSSIGTGDGDAEEPGVRWQHFSEAGYIAGDRLHSGEDKYARNKFNQWLRVEGPPPPLSLLVTAQARELGTHNANVRMPSS